MEKQVRRLVYDDALCVEAYRLEGMARSFPNHFHEYYVIGFVEDGERVLTCKNRKYTITRGSILLFNPGDDHACVQRDGGALDYRGFNIPKEVMAELGEKASGRREPPEFFPNAVFDDDAAGFLRPLHEEVMGKAGGPGKGEHLRHLISLLIRRYGGVSERNIPDCREEIEAACGFMEQHYSRRISLDEICRHTGLSKSTLLRAFVRSKGVTPYRYLVVFRVGMAKRLLERGVPPVEAALLTGFSDQSHFTNCFSRFIGLAPGIYRETFGGGDREVTKQHGPAE